MPIVQAYECPKTKKLFKDKRKYVIHLKTLALKRWADLVDHPRERIIEHKFEDARKAIRSFDDMATWLMENQRLIRALSIRYGGVYPKPASFPIFLKDVSFDTIELTDSLTNRYSKPLNGENNNRRIDTLPLSYPGVTFTIRFDESEGMRLHDAIPSMWPIHLGSGGSRHFGYAYDSDMFAEDWPFIGVHFLHKRGANPLSENEKRILTYAFPGIDENYYLSLQQTGLLPEKLEDFTEFMFKFVDPLPHVNAAQSPNIPNDVATEISI